MAVTGTISIGNSINSSPTVRSSVSRTNTGELPVINALSVATGTNTPYIIAIDVSQVTMLYIKCSIDATLKTNSTGSPANTLALKADEPVVWWSSAIWANPLTTDVTIIYLTTSGSTAYDFHLSGLYTP